MARTTVSSSVSFIVDFMCWELLGTMGVMVVGGGTRQLCYYMVQHHYVHGGHFGNPLSVIYSFEICSCGWQ